MMVRLVNLGRERRIRGNLAELHALLADNATLADRTQRLMAGELPCPGLEEENMTERELQSARIPANLMARANALVPVLEGVPELAAFGRVTKSAVIRLALFKGLQALEDEYGKPSKTRAKGRRTR